MSLKKREEVTLERMYQDIKRALEWKFIVIGYYTNSFVLLTKNHQIPSYLHKKLI